LFEFERHRFISVSTNILVELLVKLLDDARTPTRNLIVNELYFFLHVA
jgi:hypothetical protein